MRYLMTYLILLRFANIISFFQTIEFNKHVIKLNEFVMYLPGALLCVTVHTSGFARWCKNVISQWRVRQLWTL